MKRFSLVDAIILYESGELSDEQTLRLFSDLIKTGDAWTLQGSYGRMAKSLIESGLIDPKGKIAWERYEEMVCQ